MCPLVSLQTRKERAYWNHALSNDLNIPHPQKSSGSLNRAWRIIKGKVVAGKVWVQSKKGKHWSFSGRSEEGNSYVSGTCLALMQCECSYKLCLQLDFALNYPSLPGWTFPCSNLNFSAYRYQKKRPALWTIMGDSRNCAYFMAWLFIAFEFLFGEANV